MDTSKKYILMCEKAEEIQIELHKWNLDTHFHKYNIDWRSQGYCAKHKCLLTEGYDGDTDCSGFQKIRKAPHKGGWNVAEQERRYQEEDCRGNSDKFWIVLPRQDQLQEMFGSFNRCYNELVGLGCDIGTGDADAKEVAYVEDFTSMEQLWLAFVMKEKYNKTWGGEKWTKNP